MQRFYPEFVAIAGDRRIVAYSSGKFAELDVAPSGEPIEDTRSFKRAQPKLSVSGSR